MNATAIERVGAVTYREAAERADVRRNIDNSRSLKTGEKVTPNPEAVRNGSQPAPKNGSKPVVAKPVAPKTSWHIELLPVERIEPNPYQPRLSFDAQEMADLVASVRVHGVQQPIIVRSCKADLEALSENNGKANGSANGSANGKANGKANVKTNGHKPAGRTVNLVRYQLIAGERRLRASKEAGRKTIPAIIRDDLTDAQAAELALLENIQRSNLTVIEEAAGYKRLMLEFRMKEERIAKKVGKSVQTIRETIKLLNLPTSVQKLLAQKQLTAAHGRELLALAPFERLCILVATRVARDHLTALSLQATPLPNALELKDQTLIVELDYKTKFDWQSVCAKCSHKAYVRSGLASYCLKPEEWRKKQQMAVELQKQEAAQVLEAARQDGKTTVETYKLPQGSYRDLSFANLPAGCSEQCSCRSESCNPNEPTQKRPICLDPERFNALVKAEREAHEEARRRKYLALWNDAKAVLQEGEEIHPNAAALLALPIVRGEFLRWGDRESWRTLVQQIALEVKVHLPWNEIFEPEQSEFQPFTLLQDVAPRELLLFAACLVLAHEAREAVRFGGETPQLHFVLGMAPAEQPELDTSDSEASDDLEGVSGESVPGDSTREDLPSEEDKEVESKDIDRFSPDEALKGNPTPVLAA